MIDTIQSLILDSIYHQTEETILFHTFALNFACAVDHMVVKARKSE